MTIICAKYDATQSLTYLGCNSRSTMGDTILPSDVSKWQHFGKWAVAFTGNGVPFDAVEVRRADFPADEDNPYKIMRFIRKAFKEDDLGKDEDDGFNFETSGLLVRKSGGIFDFDNNLTIEPIKGESLWARGSGTDYCLGAAYALRDQNLLAKELMRASIEAAITLDAGCPGTPMIEEF